MAPTFDGRGPRNLALREIRDQSTTDAYQHNVNDLREALMGKRCCRYQRRNDGQRQSAPSQQDIEEYDH